MSLIGKTKNRQFIIKFKSMEEILLTENSWFDRYGNLCVASDYNGRSGVETLAPIYFKSLGKMKKFPQETSFPRWCIESEYEDIFIPNQALRAIASGNLNKEEQIELAKEAVAVE